MMAALDQVPILILNPDTVDTVRRMFNLEKPGAMDQAIEILDTWIKQQAHFVKKDFNRGYLERTIIKAKGSVERAKGMMDSMCTLRTELPQYFTNCNFKELLISGVKFASVPKLTKDNYRITIFENSVQNYSIKKFSDFWKLACYFVEYHSLHDYACGSIFIFDYRKTDMMELMKSMDLNEIINSPKIFVQGYDLRVKSMHFISKSKALLLIATFKQLSPAKFSDRIFAHEDLNTVYDHVDRELLPTEYGGNGPSFQKLVDKYIDAIGSEEFMEYMKEMNAAKTDESLRQTNLRNDEYLGTIGTFRSLKVD